MADETEYIRDYSLMTIFGNWSFLKNRYSEKEKYAHRFLKWVSPLGGKRESYRVKGDLVLTENDIEQHIPHKDDTASMTWDIDIHYPDEAFPRAVPFLCDTPRHRQTLPHSLPLPVLKGYF